MPNVAAVLKDEIRRVARKELKMEIASLAKQSVRHRRDIAALKRKVADLKRQVSYLEKQEGKRIAKSPSNGSAEEARFSPKWLASHRAKLGLSAAAYAELVGVSQLSIYNWESGRSRPRQPQVAKLASIRGIGKREAQRRLDLIGDT